MFLNQEYQFNKYFTGGGETVSRSGTGSNGWLCQGTHHASDKVGNEFHIISSGHGDNKANRCEIDVTQISRNDNLTFSCKLDGFQESQP